MVLRLEDIPNCFPIKISKNIIKAISGPDTYQGQGSKIHSIVPFFNEVQINCNLRSKTVTNVTTKDLIGFENL
tara:strand:+ start:253 stop:471 length:219 start_codon:yes stop_codon:yes gene_type:complete